MAHLDEKSIGNFTKLYYKKTAFEQITEVNNLPSPSDEAAQVSIQEFGVQYQTTLPGSKTVSPIELVLNWNPSNASHADLVAYYGSQETVEFYIEYTNSAGTKSTYRTFSARVGSNSIGSEFDSARTMTCRLDVIGGMGAITDTIPT